MTTPLLLFSTNTYLKFRIQENYREQHYAWCSTAFSANALDKYALGAGTPPSSDPASIYRDLCDAIDRTDEHNAKINSQRATLLALAVDWFDAGFISANQRDDISMTISKAVFSHWRPLLFVIPYALVAARVQEVPRDKRASMEPEYIVPDLKRYEFGIVEF
jgi:hypothetical protein